MPFATFLKLNYANACKKMREVAKDSDLKMTEMLASGDHDPATVKRWMRGYGLFQGISTEKRNKIANAYLAFAENHEQHREIDDDVIATIYSDLYRMLYKAVGRK